MGQIINLTDRYYIIDIFNRRSPLFVSSKDSDSVKKTVNFGDAIEFSGAEGLEFVAKSGDYGLRMISKLELACDDDDPEVPALYATVLASIVLFSLIGIVISLFL